MLVVDGTDLSAYIKDEGDYIEYEKVKGKHGGIVLSGQEIEETLAIKVILEYECEILTLDQFKRLTDIFKKEVVSVTYFEPNLKSQRTASMKPQTLSGKKALETDGEYYYDEVVIGFRED